MRAALIISGYLRTLRLNTPNIQTKIFGAFDQVDVYIHVTKDEEKEDRYLNTHNTDEDIAFINESLKPVCLLLENNVLLLNDKKENNIINLWLKCHKLNELKKINEEIYGKYDLVIKYRPDLNIISDKIFSDDTTKDIIYIPMDSKIDRAKLTRASDNFLCDIFAYGNSHTMDQYFSIYKHMHDLMNKHGPVSETLLYEFLNESKIAYKLIDLEYCIILSTCNVFAICGDSGSGKTTLGNLLKGYFSESFILECDRYHKWSRNDENWGETTHLNPDANYITKMKEDIFNLKIGKTIFQVNYDHSKGIFTDKEEISASDNIVVCGLHSLYHDNDHIYNLKIFMDTDINLKIKWKIARDTTLRGYTKNEILNQINNRKDDYIKFIYPQREKSDLVVNFFIPETGNHEISLKLLIKKKFNVLKIINDLQALGIKLTLGGGNEPLFNEVMFPEYQKINMPRNATGSIPHNYGNYYDYILFFIFNLMRAH